MDLSHLAKNWPSSIVARTELKKFTGGMMSPGTLANIDSKREGPPQIKLGRKVGYRVDDLVKWLEKRVSAGK